MRHAGGNGHLVGSDGEVVVLNLRARMAEICDDAMSATTPPKSKASGAPPQLPAPPDPAEAATRLDSVHYTLEGFWQRLGESAADDWKMLFELAVCEIAANIIEHARAEVMEFDISITRDGNRVVAEFTDTGKPYPRSAKRAKDEYDERGRGLTLAQSVLDELRYERTGATNIWKLVKEL
jgi:serine/threonine-protein kinase RsbW